MKRIKDLPIGSLVQLGAHKISNEANTHPLTWIIADKNHSGYPENSVTLITKHIIDLRPFDAKESRNDTQIARYGNSVWLYSNISIWLSSVQNDWYSQLHEYDEAPTNTTTTMGTHYANNRGFLYHFTEYEKSILLYTTLKTPPTSVYPTLPTESQRKVFLITATEAGCDLSSPNSGSMLQIFEDLEYLGPTVSQECINNTLFTGTKPLSDEAYVWITRSPASAHEIIAIGITHSPFTYPVNACNGGSGIRPATNLSGDIFVYDEPVDGSYRIIEIPSSAFILTDFNAENDVPVRDLTPTIHYYLSHPKNTPVKMTFKLNGAEVSSYTVLSDNVEISYTLDNGAFRMLEPWVAPASPVINTLQITASSNLGTTVKTVRFIRVVNNPTIIAEDIATPVGEFTTWFKVQDNNIDGTLFGTIYVDTPTKTLLNMHKIPRDTKIEYIVPEAVLDTLSTGTHNIHIDITNTNPGGLPLRSKLQVPFNYNRQDGMVIKFMTKIMDVDAMPTSLLSLLIYSVNNGGAVLKVEACNNANDTSPVWENITGYVNKVESYEFRNTLCTSGSWAIQLRFTLTKTVPTQQLMVHAVGFSYR